MSNLHLYISIHAPTNGATQSRLDCPRLYTISIHAPTNGATLKTFTRLLNLINFNPRSDERSDEDLTRLEITFGISIHAPTNGATSVRSQEPDPIQISIHAPTNGATMGIPLYDDSYTISIHAPTNGATESNINKIYSVIISIHAPTNGATNIPCVFDTLVVFQSTLRRTERH